MYDTCPLFGSSGRYKWQKKKKRCLHDMEELTHVELKNEQGNTIGEGFILICKNGRTEELTHVELKDERGNTIGDGFILIV